MFCTECGTKNRDGAKFCMVCGHAMEAPAPAVAPATPMRPSVSVAAPSPAQASANTSSPTANSSSERSDFYRQRSERIQKLTGVKGWLWFLCLSLGVLGPAIAVFSMTGVWMDAIRGEGAAAFVPRWRDYLAIYSLMAVGVVVAAMLTAYRLYKEAPGAAKLAKAYYLLTPVVITLWDGFFWEAYGFGAMGDRMLVSAVTPESVRMFASSIIWLLYLQFSRRVRYTYPDPAEHVRCPECRGFVHKYSIQCRHCGVKLVPADAR